MKTDMVTCSNREESSEYLFYLRSFLEGFHSAIGSKEISKQNIFVNILSKIKEKVFIRSR